MKYVIEEITIDPEYGFNREYGIVIGQEKIVLERSYDNCDEDFRVKAESVTEAQGWFQRYGNKNSPMEEIQAQWGGLEQGTEIRKYRDKAIWEFHGNHQHYSAAFSYIIWDKKLASAIEKTLRKQGLMQ